MKKVVALALAVSACFMAFSQERTFLTKAEVEPLTSGKKWTYVRARDGSKINWDMRSGGYLFANNRTNGRSDSGTWLVNDQGHICTKWRGNSGDGCFALFKEGEKIKRVGAEDLNGAADEVTVE